MARRPIDADLSLSTRIMIAGGVVLMAWLTEKPKKEEHKGAPPRLQRQNSVEAAKHNISYDADIDIESLMCPITQELIVEPASTIHGHLFELSAI